MPAGVSTASQSQIVIVTAAEPPLAFPICAGWPAPNGLKTNRRRTAAAERDGTGWEVGCCPQPWEHRTKVADRFTGERRSAPRRGCGKLDRRLRRGGDPISSFSFSPSCRHPGYRWPPTSGRRLRSRTDEDSSLIGWSVCASWCPRPHGPRPLVVNNARQWIRLHTKKYANHHAGNPGP